MIESLALLVLVSTVALIWHEAVRSRDRAANVARQLCARADLQLLDQSVGLRRISIVRAKNGQPGLRREYGFDVSTNGHDRHRGTLVLRAGLLENFSLPLREAPPPTETVGNVTYLAPRIP
ncbi:MAG TPA: DUF3301 domain-containing protein [Tahibacter sp.]|nr:DUF3301 domain-containing protein [Tahibacter sp.]